MHTDTTFAEPGPRLTLSVVSHGHGPLLRNLLGDLSACEGLDRALVVVTLNLAGEAFDPGAWPALHIEVIRNGTPRGFGANHNAAFERCRTPWFAILNPDLRIPDRACFTTLLAAAQAAPSLGLLAPVVCNVDGHEEDSVRLNLTLPSLLSRHRRCPPAGTRTPTRPGQPFYWLAGMFLLADASTFRRVGGFDERFFLYCEDYDLSARIYIAGRVLAQLRTVRVIHDARRDSHRSARHLRMHIASLLKVWASAAFWKTWWLDRRAVRA